VAAMCVAPLLWLAARRVWDAGAAWTATLLYVLDLSVWHHLGRSHAPAVFGGAVGAAALLHLAVRADGLGQWRPRLVAAAGLALAVLGYSSLVVVVGLFGLVLLALLALLAWRGLRIAALARDPFGALIAAGVVSMLVFQAFVNIGMTIGIMPITGIPLPFVSYGGSSLVSSFLAVGLLENVHMRRYQ